MNYPDYTTCLSLLKNEGVPENVIRHLKTVHRFSMTIGKSLIEQGHSVNMQLLEAGALLHDIGRSKTHKIGHASAGSIIAQRLGLPRDLTGIIANHIGAGISKEEAIKQGLPAKDYFPVSIEEKIVAAADNLTGGEKHRTIVDNVQSMRERGLADAAERCLALHNELSDMCGIDLDELLMENS